MVEGVVFRDGVRTDERVAIDGVPSLAKQAGVFIWIDVEDPTEDTLMALAGEFRLHPLVVEDARHRRQRPKVELFSDYVFVVLRAAAAVLFDEVVDGYFSAVERFEEMADDLEDDIFAKEDGQGESPRHMPELEWRFGYAFAVGTIVASALGLYAWFKWKKRWL